MSLLGQTAGKRSYESVQEAVHESHHEYTNGKTTDPPFRPIRVFVKNSWTG